MKCSDCGHENFAGALLCASCGADLYDLLLEQVTTRELSNDEKAATSDLKLSEPGSSRPVLFYIGADQIPVSVDRLNELYIGRSDKETGLVQIDLDRFGGRDNGVSRKHARFDAQSEKPEITDLGSYNGTYINGQRLVPQRAYALESGDELRLGRLTVRVYYK